MVALHKTLREKKSLESYFSCVNCLLACSILLFFFCITVAIFKQNNMCVTRSVVSLIDSKIVLDSQQIQRPYVKTTALRKSLKFDPRTTKFKQSQMCNVPCTLIDYNSSQIGPRTTTSDVSTHDVSTTSDGCTSDDSTIKQQQKWAVISLAIPSDVKQDMYAFCIPLAIAAWKNIGWDVLVILTGDENVWKEQGSLVESTSMTINPKTKFVAVKTPPEQKIAYSQIVRSYSTLFIDEIQPDDFVLISDVDLLPVNGRLFNSLDPLSINIMNADCGPMFEWKCNGCQGNVTVREHPMAHIGTTKILWNQLMELGTTTITTDEVAPFIQKWLEEKYGQKIEETQVIKGGEGWSLDQRSISVQIFQHWEIPTKKIRRNCAEQDRINRAFEHSWPSKLSDEEFFSKIDFHVFQPPFGEGQWPEMVNFIKRYFDTETKDLLFQYREKFIK